MLLTSKLSSKIQCRTIATSFAQIIRNMVERKYICNRYHPIDLHTSGVHLRIFHAQGRTRLTRLLISAICRRHHPYRSLIIPSKWYSVDQSLFVEPLPHINWSHYSFDVHTKKHTHNTRSFIEPGWTILSSL